VGRTSSNPTSAAASVSLSSWRTAWFEAARGLVTIEGSSSCPSLPQRGGGRSEGESGSPVWLATRERSGWRERGIQLKNGPFGGSLLCPRTSRSVSNFEPCCGWTSSPAALHRSRPSTWPSATDVKMRNDWYRPRGLSLSTANRPYDSFAGFLPEPMNDEQTRQKPSRSAFPTAR